MIYTTADLKTGFRCARIPFYVYVTVERTVDYDVTNGGDGIGTLCLVLLDGCPMDLVNTIAPITVEQIDNVSFESVDDSFWYDMTLSKERLQNASTLYIAAFLLENGGSCEFGPEIGDLYSAELTAGEMGCGVVDPSQSDGSAYVYLNAVVESLI